MKTRPIAFALLLAFTPATLSFPVPAFAQQDDASVKAARQRFEEGVQFYDKKQYESARAAFMQAYALRKHPAILLNLGQSCLKSGHHAEAAKFFQQYLREASNITPAQRSDADQGLAEARTKLGRLEVSAPTAAEISVDGAVAGNAPLSDPVDVEPGTHTVKARMTDGTVDTRSVSASAGEKVKVTFTTAAPPPPVVAPVPTPAPTQEPAPTPPPESTAPKDEHPNRPLVEPPEEQKKSKGLLSPPKTMVPVYIGAGLAVVGIVDAIVFGVAKSQAQDKANQVAADIKSHGGSAGVCVSKDPTVQAKYGAACSALSDDNSKVDTDATLANIGVGVAIAGAALGIGWYLFAPKKGNDEAPTAAKSAPPISPMIGPGFGGAVFHSTF